MTTSCFCLYISFLSFFLPFTLAFKTPHKIPSVRFVQRAGFCVNKIIDKAISKTNKTKQQVKRQHPRMWVLFICLCFMQLDLDRRMAVQEDSHKGRMIHVKFLKKFLTYINRAVQNGAFREKLISLQGVFFTNHITTNP